jgi:hypothetical protein
MGPCRSSGLPLRVIAEILERFETPEQIFEIILAKISDVPTYSLQYRASRVYV